MVETSVNPEHCCLLLKKYISENGQMVFPSRFGRDLSGPKKTQLLLFLVSTSRSNAADTGFSALSRTFFLISFDDFSGLTRRKPTASLSRSTWLANYRKKFKCNSLRRSVSLCGSCKIRRQSNRQALCLSLNRNEPARAVSDVIGATSDGRSVLRNTCSVSADDRVRARVRRSPPRRPRDPAMRVTFFERLLGKLMAFVKAYLSPNRPLFFCTAL